MRDSAKWQVSSPGLMGRLYRWFKNGSAIYQSMRFVQRLIQHSRCLSRIYWLLKYLTTDPYCAQRRARERYLDAVKLVPRGSGQEVLELGCGEGHFTTFLADRGMQVLATDISLLALRRAKRRLANRRTVTFALVDLAHDDIGVDRFSLIVCMETLYYIPADLLDDCVRKIWNAVKVDGFILLGHRRERPQSNGVFRIPFGAETIHDRFRAVSALTSVAERDRVSDLFSLFKRRSS